MRKTILVLMATLMVGCSHAPKHHVHEKAKCKDLEVYGVQIPSHLDCEE